MLMHSRPDADYSSNKTTNKTRDSGRGAEEREGNRPRGIEGRNQLMMLLMLRLTLIEFLWISFVILVYFYCLCTHVHMCGCVCVCLFPFLMIIQAFVAFKVLSRQLV